MLCLALRPVDDKGELLKREEADTERKQYMSQCKVCLKNRIYIFKEEIIILKVKQNTQI